MGFLLKAGKTQSQQQPAITGLDIQTSSYGKVIPLAYGTTRVAPNIIWYGDFTSRKSGSGQAGKAGGGAVGSSSYTYSTALMFALCEGEIDSIGHVYVDKYVYPDISAGTVPGFTLFAGAYGQAPWGYLTSNHPDQALGYSGIAYVAAAPYNLADSPSLSNHNFEVFGKFSDSVSGSDDADPSLVTADFLTNEHYGSGFPPERLGQLNQSDESHTVATTVTVSNAGFYQNLAVQDSLGNLFTCVASTPAVGQYSFSEGTYAFNASDVGKTVTISYAWVSALTTYQNYTLAANLLISPSYTDQSQASSILNDLVQATNSATVWSSGVLGVVPYGDASLTGNGHTYTPPSSPLFDLTDDDFLPNTNASGGASSSSNADPVLLTRTRAADQYNSIKLEYLDRTNNYNVAVVEAKDQASAELFGLRQDTSRNGHMFADGNIALQSAWLQLQRQSIRNTYQFTLDQRYIVLDVMDLVTLTDANLGLTRQWVRITQITENDDYSLTFTAEEYLAGTGNVATYSYEPGQGYQPSYNTSPGDANVPVILDAPVQIATTSGLEVWMVASGGPNWGGADVYISSDEENYKLAGRIQGNGRQGLLSASLPSGSDPDTVHALSVDLTESRGELLSGTLNDADQGNTLCYVDGELISYQTATLTATNKYDLTYLRRGMYGTAISSHASGTQFARLDSDVFVYSYNKDQIGQTIYIKLLSFNIVGGAEQTLADVDPYTHVIVGPPAPANVTNFLVAQNGNAVNFTWTQVADYALQGYDIGYAPEGSTDWHEFTMLTEASKGTEMTNAAVPAGTWTFGIRARDIADQLSPDISTFDLVIVNDNDTTTVQKQEPDFSGSMSGFVRHWTGVLVPESASLANAYSDYSLFDNFVLDPVSTAYYITPTYDIGFVNSLRVHSAYSLTVGPGQTGTPAATTELDAWTSGSDPGTYVNWTVGTIPVRYLNMKIVYAPTSGQVAYLSDFTYTVDRSPTIEQSQSQTISSGGEPITFPQPFHEVPYVTATAISSTALYATVSNVTTTGCTIHVWNPSGTDVGGVAAWKATGV